LKANLVTLTTFLELQRSIYLFQERNRAIYDAYGTGLSLLEGRLLTEISAQRGITAKNLHTHLQVSATLLSRTIDKLISSKLIKASIINSDRRQKALTLTSKGLNILAEFDKLADANLNNFYSRLSKAEASNIEKYFNYLADGLGAPKTSYKRKEHPLRSNIRRITQALGLLENSKSPIQNINNLEWHILLSLQKYSGSISAKTLVVNFSSPLNTIASALKRLEQKKLIIKYTLKSDRRKQILELTEHGNKILNISEKCGAERLMSALNMLTITQVKELTALIHLMIGESNLSAVSPEGYKLEFCVLNSNDQLRKAREFFCIQAVRLDKADKIKENLFTQKSFCCAFMNSNEIHACLEIQFNTDNRSTNAVLTHLACKSSMQDLPIEAQFIEYARNECLKKYGDIKITIDQDWYSET
jgi:DNA-binding MarR family transcriptional regulator